MLRSAQACQAELVAKRRLSLAQSALQRTGRYTEVTRSFTECGKSDDVCVECRAERIQ